MAHDLFSYSCCFLYYQRGRSIMFKTTCSRGSIQKLQQSLSGCVGLSLTKHNLQYKGLLIRQDAFSGKIAPVNILTHSYFTLHYITEKNEKQRKGSYIQSKQGQRSISAKRKTEKSYKNISTSTSHNISVAAVKQAQSTV